MESSMGSSSKNPLLELPLEIWLEIFQLATHAPRSTSLRPADPFTLRLAPSWNILIAQNTRGGVLHTKVSLTGVCRPWRTLALPLLYQHVVIKGPMRARLILRTLTDSRRPDDPVGHGKWLRHIEVLTHARGSGSLQYLQSLFGIFRCCPDVRVFSGTWNYPLPPPFLDAIAKIYGSGLEELYWNEIAGQLAKRAVSTLATVATLKFLGSFSGLRMLDLRHFKANALSPDTPGDVPASAPTFPLVRDLIVSTNPWSIAAASHIALPRLSSLTVKVARGFTHAAEDGFSGTELSKSFISAHGSSLESVDIHPASPDDDLEQYSSNAPSARPMDPGPFLDAEACPNLTSICYPVCPNYLPLPDGNHPKLRRIGLRDVKSDFLCLTRDKPDHVVKDHLQALYSNVTAYTGLELVQTIGFCVGKSTMKDVFIWWVEHFARKGVLLLDGEGVFWEYEEAVVPKQLSGHNAFASGCQKGLGMERRNTGVVCWRMMDCE